MKRQSRNACCEWKRSRNDALLDPSTEERYCGTCWQKWLLSKATLSQKGKGVSDSEQKIIIKEPSANEVMGVVSEGKEPGDLQKFIDKDGKVYLISPERYLAFNAERRDDGKLCCVGDLVCDGKDKSVKLYDVKSIAHTTSFPFPTEPEDHCETPFAAYDDLSRYLQHFSKQIGKSRQSLKIWDPFFCNGAVKQNLGRLGFLDVYNECEDFYAVVKNGNFPEHDCIVTNPPYSSKPTDHIQELFKYLCSQRKPWFVLQPNYVYMKPYWQELTSTALPAPRPFFLTPSSPRKYKYRTPSGIRQVNSAQKLRTSPFVSMWYCWLDEKHAARMFKWIASTHGSALLPLALACSEYFIPDSFKDSNDRTRRKKRKQNRLFQSQDSEPLSTMKSQSSKKRKKRETPVA